MSATATARSFALVAQTQGCDRRVRVREGQGIAAFDRCDAQGVTFVVGDGHLSVQCADHPFRLSGMLPFTIADCLR